MSLIYKTSRARIKELVQSIKDYTILGISDKGVPTEFLISAFMNYVPDLTNAMTQFISNDNLIELDERNELASDVAPSQKSIVHYIKSASGISNAISGCPAGMIGEKSGGADGVGISDIGNPYDYKRSTISKEFFDQLKVGFAYIHTGSSDTSDDPVLTWGGFDAYGNQREIRVGDIVKATVNVENHGEGNLWMIVMYIHNEGQSFDWAPNIWEVSGRIIFSSLDGATGGISNSSELNIVEGLTLRICSPEGGIQIDDPIEEYDFNYGDDLYYSQFIELATKSQSENRVIELKTEDLSLLPFSINDLVPVSLLFSNPVLNDETEEQVLGSIYYKPLSIYITYRLGPRPRPGAAPARIPVYHVILEPLFNVLGGFSGAPGTIADVILDTGISGGISNSDTTYTVYINGQSQISSSYFDSLISNDPHYVFCQSLEWNDKEIGVGSVIRIKLAVSDHGYGYIFYKVEEINTIAGYLSQRLTCSVILYTLDGSDGSISNTILISPLLIDSYDLSNVTYNQFNAYKEGIHELTIATSDISDVSVNDLVRFELKVSNYGSGTIFAKVTGITSGADTSVLSIDSVFGVLDGKSGVGAITDAVDVESGNDVRLGVGRGFNYDADWFSIRTNQVCPEDKFRILASPYGTDDYGIRYLRIYNATAWATAHVPLNNLLNKVVCVKVLVSTSFMGTQIRTLVAFYFKTGNRVEPVLGESDAYNIQLDVIDCSILGLYGLFGNEIRLRDELYDPDRPEVGEAILTPNRLSIKGSDDEDGYFKFEGMDWIGTETDSKLKVLNDIFAAIQSNGSGGFSGGYNIINKETDDEYYGITKDAKIGNSTLKIKGGIIVEANNVDGAGSMNDEMILEPKIIELATFTSIVRGTDSGGSPAWETPIPVTTLLSVSELNRYRMTANNEGVTDYAEYKALRVKTSSFEATFGSIASMIDQELAVKLLVRTSSSTQVMVYLCMVPYKQVVDSNDSAYKYIFFNPLNLIIIGTYTGTAVAISDEEPR